MTALYQKQCHYTGTPNPIALAQMSCALSMPFAVRGALMNGAISDMMTPTGSVIATRDVIVPGWLGPLNAGLTAVETRFKRDDIVRHATRIQQRIETDLAIEPERFDAPHSLMVQIACDPETQHLWLLTESCFSMLSDDHLEFVRLANKQGVGEGEHTGFKAHSPEAESFLSYMQSQHRTASFLRLKHLSRAELALMRIHRGGADWQHVTEANSSSLERWGGVWIHRKRALRADLAEKLVLSTRESALIAQGQGQVVSLWSVPAYLEHSSDIANDVGCVRTKMLEPLITVERTQDGRTVATINL